MKKLITLSVLLVTGFAFAQAPLETAVEPNPIVMKYAETITIEDMREDLMILASDALEGRETGKRGQKMAAAYIKAHFEELGIEGPVKTGNGYYQDVPFVTSKAGVTYLKIGDNKLTNLKDFMYMGSPKETEETSTEVVFAGSGSEKGFENIDVSGKSILVINSNRRERGKIIAAAEEKGVEKVFIVRTEDQSQYEGFMKRFSRYFSRANMTIDKKRRG